MTVNITTDTEESIALPDGIKHGIYAFPFSVSELIACSGMTLRDYFAAQAMGNLFARNRAGALVASEDATAEIAYRLADAMMQERANIRERVGNR